MKHERCSNRLNACIAIQVKGASAFLMCSVLVGYVRRMEVIPLYSTYQIDTGISPQISPWIIRIQICTNF